MENDESNAVDDDIQLEVLPAEVRFSTNRHIRFQCNLDLKTGIAPDNESGGHQGSLIFNK